MSICHPSKSIPLKRLIVDCEKEETVINIKDIKKIKPFIDNYLSNFI